MMAAKPIIQAIDAGNNLVWERLIVALMSNRITSVKLVRLFWR